MSKTIAEQNVEKKQRQEETRRKFVTMMSSSHEARLHSIFANTFAVWARLIGELRKEKEGERRVLVMLAGNQGRAVLAQVMVVWSRLVKDAKQKRMHTRQ